MDSQTLQTCNLQLLRTYDEICWKYKVNLRRPTIAIVDALSFLGRWNPVNRSIELTQNLLLQWSWDDVCSVLKHEMAHQIVTEVFNVDSSDHGPHFIKAGEMLGLSPRFLRAQTEYSTQLPKEHNEDPAPIFFKIEKLLSLAQSTNEHEAHLAMKKALELLSQHHIGQLQKPPQFLYKIIDTQKKRVSTITHRICGLLMGFYYVDIVLNESFRVSNGQKTKTVEIFGRNENVKIADYVFHFLHHCAEDLWRAYSRNHKAAHKKSYQLGLIEGFEKKLLEQKKSTDAHGLAPMQGALVLKEEKALKQFIRQRHPRLTRRQGNRSSIDPNVYNNGLQDGRNIVIHKGIHHTTISRGLLAGRVLR